MQANRNRSARAVALFLLASGLQLPLFAAFTATTQGAATAPCTGPGCKPPEKGRILATLTPPPQPPPPERPLVDLPDQPELPRPPTPADKVSDKTTRTERETVRPQAPRPKQPQPAQPESPDTANPSAPDRPESAVPDGERPNPSGQAPSALGERPASILDRRRPGGALERPTTDGAALRNAMRMADPGMVGDPSNPDDVEVGARTVMNADRHRFADFFLRVKRDLEVHWDPAGVYRRNDPSGERFGVKDRYTVLLVTLDPAGALVKMVTSRPSGLDFLDEEARRAFRLAAPFANPPQGLIGKDGNIRFEFGFYFEITGGTTRTRWRRL